MKIVGVTCVIVGHGCHRYFQYICGCHGKKNIAYPTQLGALQGYLRRHP